MCESWNNSLIVIKVMLGKMIHELTDAVIETTKARIVVYSNCFNQSRKDYNLYEFTLF